VPVVFAQLAKGALMGPERLDRVAVLVVRAWEEDQATGTWRARTVKSLDVQATGTSSAVVGTPADLRNEVDDWLEALIEILETNSASKL
jgi:hypothetical protein